MRKLAQAAVVSSGMLCVSAAQAASYEQIYAFAGGSDAASPTNALLHIGTQFIGTTCTGGANNLGAIYSVTPGGKEYVIYSFGGINGGVCPSSALLVAGKKPYGTTQRGGAYNSGTVFVMNVLAGKIGVPSTIHSFSNTGTDGEYPGGGLTLFNNTIYGTTAYGGASTNCHYSGCGTVFFITQHNRVGTLYSFQGEPDGALPATTLLPVGNLLFGTTRAGGTGGPCDMEGAEIDGCGTVFSITPRGEEKPVYAFQGGGNDGSFPNATLVKDGVALYGTTQYGGGGNCMYGNSNSGCGIVFAVTTGGAERVLHKFGNGDGYWPEAGLTLLNGLLYGSTSAGGPDIEQSYASIFSIAPAGGLKILYKYASSGPAALLTAAGNTLWGTTNYGGTVNNANCGIGCGTIFRLTP